MNRQQKTVMIEKLKTNFSDSSASFLIGYKGLTVAQMQSLRKKLRANGGSLQVTKARIMKRAVDNLEAAEELKPFLKNQIGLVFAPTDIAGVAKTLSDFAKEHQALTLIAGCLEAQLLDGVAVERIASLPSREVLLAQVCGTLKAPISNFASALNQMLCKPIWVIKQIGEQKQ